MADSNGNIIKRQVTINMAANIVSYSGNIIISFILTPFLINTLGKTNYKKSRVKSKKAKNVYAKK